MKALPDVCTSTVAQSNLLKQPVLDVKSNANSAWILNDAGGIAALSAALKLKGVTVSKQFDLDTLHTAASVNTVLADFKSNAPAVLWVNIPARLHSWTNVSSRRLAVLISALCFYQLSENRHIVIEGGPVSSHGWHSEKFDKVLKHARVNTSQVRWCALGISDESSLPVCRYSRILTTYSVPHSALLCSHIADKSKLKHFPRNMWQSYYASLVDLSIAQVYATVPDAAAPVKKKKLREKVSFIDGVDGPGEHADSQEITTSAPYSKAKTAADVEDVFDDCGDDVSPLELAETFAMFDDSSSDESIENSAFANLFDSEYYSWALIGSAPCDEEDLSLRPVSAHHESMESVLVVLDDNPGLHDVMELFGGEGKVVKLSIRRHLKGGRNLDLTTGVDLLDPLQVTALWRYLRKHRPRIVVCGPPCTSFGAWSRINRLRNPIAFRESRRIGVLLANLAADVCEHQLNTGNHFLAENPLQSELWYLPKWKALRSHDSVSEVTLDQCTVGLCDPEGHLTQKSTLLLASHPCLINRLARRCQKDHPHVQLAGSAGGIPRCRYAQAWPRRMVELIVCGIVELFSLTERSAQCVPNYPAQRRYNCPGCNLHAAKHDVRHSRTDDCKFPFVDSIVWNCPSCKQHKGSTHMGHSFEVGDCQWAVAPTRRHVQDRQQKDPRVPEHVNKDAVDDVVEPPANVNQISWTMVTNLETITWLDQLRTRDGWHPTRSNIALVETNCRRLRTCEPRLDAQRYKWRSVYAMFPEHTHAHGPWYQLEDHVLFTDPSYDSKAVCMPPIPVCVLVFHDEAAPPPTINKTRLQPTAKVKAGHPNPFKTLVDEWDEDESLGGGPVAPAAAAEYDEQVEPPIIGEELGEDLPIPEPDWSSWDLGRVIRALRSDVPGQKTRALRKLHVRWFHCSAVRMTNMLRAAGCDKATLDSIPSIVDTCKACRLWRRPTNKPTTSSRLSSRLNECVQVDLLFTAGGIVIHAIDEATRFTMAGLIPDRTPQAILDWFMSAWVRYFGPPKVLLSDQEGALCSDEAAVWCERQSIELRLRPKGSHASTVERHHQILRDQINRMKAQCSLEHLTIPLPHLIAEAVFAKKLSDNHRRLFPLYCSFRNCPAVFARARRAWPERDHR